MTNLHYTADPFRYVRRRTRVVQVGDCAIGGDNPIRVQSMTNTDTRDTAATVQQIASLYHAGCEIARVAAPSITDAESLADLKAELTRREIPIPLVADIHFTPNAAMAAALHVEKVRINPGNYADKKKFEVREYSDSEYAAELERVGERFRPLVIRCRERDVAMRIGTNHGSLSDRILNRFGDTPLGMVESALEFLDVCEDEDYRDVVFSMKASNTQVAIQAYRLLAQRLDERSGGAPSYPFHVGVTEAGDGEDGRVKSAIGIGSLLEDGIGDTIRVSLTEDPVREVPVARALADRAARQATRPAPGRVAPSASFVADPFAHARRESAEADWGLPVAGEQPVRVELEAGALPSDPEAFAEHLSRELSRLRDVACESLGVRASEGDAAVVAKLADALLRQGLALPLAVRTSPAGLCDLAAHGVRPGRWAVTADADSEPAALRAISDAARGSGRPLEWILCGDVHEVFATLERTLAACPDAAPETLAFSVESPWPIHAMRAVVAGLAERGVPAALVLRHIRDAGHGDSDARLAASVDLGTLLCDGLGDAISLGGFPDSAAAVDLGYRILQGARLRTSRTEYISCPSCGRTLFDLEETTARIKQRTEHLKGVKIAVMGCIVNGPGEMADADFGYVGSGVGQVTLYEGKEVVARAVPEGEAPDRLVDIIREAGCWNDPS